MPNITFSREERAVLVPTIRAWVREELDHDLSGLQADMLIDFIARQMGPAFYNRALFRGPGSQAPTRPPSASSARR